MNPTVAAILAALQGVTGLLKGVNFTKTPHLSWDQAYQVALSMKKSLADLYVQNNGNTKSAADQCATQLIQYLAKHAGQPSWGTEAEPIMNTVANEKIKYDENPGDPRSFIEEALMWRWVIYVALNYDSRRPDEFRTELVARTKQVFNLDFDVSGSGGAVIGSTINNLFSSIGNLFSKITGGTPGAGTTTTAGTGGIDTMQVILAFAFLGIVVWFVAKKMKK